MKVGCYFLRMFHYRIVQLFLLNDIKNAYCLNQFQWTYTGHYGQAYYVGIAHGAETGHLVIYCNKSIIAIDFNVQQSKKYSFFIDDELVDLSIEKVGKNFSYTCNINKDANTNRNQERRKNAREEYRLLMSGIIIVLLIVLIVLRYGNAT